MYFDQKHPDHDMDLQQIPPRLEIYDLDTCFLHNYLYIISWDLYENVQKHLAMLKTVENVS